MLSNMDKILESVSEEARKKQVAIDESTIVLSETVVLAIEECIENDTLENFIESVLYETSIQVIEAKSSDDEDEDEDKKDDDSKDDDEEEGKKKKDDDSKDDDEEEGKKKKDDEEPVEEKKGCKESFIIGEGLDIENIDIDAVIKEADAAAVAAEPKKSKSKFSGAQVWEMLNKAWAHLVEVFNTTLEKLGDAILTVFNQDKAIAERSADIKKGLPLIKNVKVKTTSFENTKVEKLSESVFNIFWSKMVELVSGKGGKLVSLGALNGFTPEIEKLGEINMVELMKEAAAFTVKKYTGTEATAVEGAFSAYFRGKAVGTVGEFMTSNDVIANCSNGAIKNQIAGANKVINIIKSNVKTQGNAASKDATPEHVAIIKKIDVVVRQAADLEMKKNIAFLQAVRARTVASFNIAKVAIKAAGAETPKAGDNKQIGVKEAAEGDVVSEAIKNLFV